MKSKSMYDQSLMKQELQVKSVLFGMVTRSIPDFSPNDLLIYYFGSRISGVFHTLKLLDFFFYTWF